MKRVLSIAVLLFATAPAVAVEWNAFGPELSAEPDLAGEVTVYEDDQAAPVPAGEVDGLPMAEPMMALPFPSRVAGGHCCRRPSCCENVWAGYSRRPRCCGSLWSDYCATVQDFCCDTRCQVQCLRGGFQPSCDSCYAVPSCETCYQPAPVCDPCCESCDPCCEKRFSLSRLCDRIGDCCGDFSFCSLSGGCDAGCEASCDCGYQPSCECEYAPSCDCDVCDPCGSCGHKWFSGGLLSGLFRSKHQCACPCEGGVWYEGGYAPYEYESSESVVPVPAPQPVPEDDHAASRLRLPSFSDWLRF